jgi:hypothetical protein
MNGHLGARMCEGWGISRRTLDGSEINALRLVPHPHTAALLFVSLMPPHFRDLILLTSAATSVSGLFLQLQSQQVSLHVRQFLFF